LVRLGVQYPIRKMGCLIVIAGVVIVPVGLMAFLVSRHQIDLGWAVVIGVVFSLGALAYLSGTDFGEVASIPGGAEDKGLAILEAAAEVCGGIGVVIGVVVGVAGGLLIADATKEE
jgi:hypothetical protein